MTTGGNPTGIVFNGSDAFVVTQGALTGPRDSCSPPNKA
jgi:hypothetical protein